MKNKTILIVGFVGIILFIIVSSYFWHIYFLDFNNDGKINHNSDKQGSIVLVNIKNVSNNVENNVEGYDDIPSYEFRIDNRKTGSVNYILYIEDIPSDKVKDGCSEITTLKRTEMSYELKLNSQVIRSGLLSSIEDNVLDKQFINIDVSNNYELKIWINEDTIDWRGKHYHYKVTLKEA